MSHSRLVRTAQVLAVLHTTLTTKYTKTQQSKSTGVFPLSRSILSRTALVSDLSSKGVVNLVSDEVRQIYSLLEADFTPLELCQRLAPLLEKLETVTEPMSGVTLLLMLSLLAQQHVLGSLLCLVGAMCLYMYQGLACDIQGIHLEVLTQHSTSGANGAASAACVCVAHKPGL